MYTIPVVYTAYNNNKNLQDTLQIQMDSSLGVVF